MMKINDIVHHPHHDQKAIKKEKNGLKMLTPNKLLALHPILLVQ